MLTAEILKRACGKLSLEEVEKYVKSNRFIQFDGSHVTTEQAKYEEEQLLDLVRGGWDTCQPIGRDSGLDLGGLTDEQRRALEHIVSSKDVVMDVSGIAGAGKSHLLKQVERAVSVGQSVAILSPTDASVKDIGVFGDYSHTWTSLNPGGHIDVDSGRGGLYATWFSHGIYLNAAIYGGHDSYDSGRAGLGGLANGSTEGAEWSTFIGGGYDFHLAQLTVGPIASLQYTDVGIDSFSEHGSLAPSAIHSDSAESLRSDVGFRLFYQWQIGKIIVEPSLKASWEHEYKYSALPVTAGFAGIPRTLSEFLRTERGSR